jgi:tetratricopeptide (TPR) repeat protein
MMMLFRRFWVVVVVWLVSFGFAEEFLLFPAAVASTNPQAITGVLSENPSWLTVLAYVPEPVILVGPVGGRSRVVGERFVLGADRRVVVRLSVGEGDRLGTVGVVERVGLPFEVAADGVVVGPFDSVVAAQEAEFVLRSNGFVFASRIVVVGAGGDGGGVVGSDLVPADAAAGRYVVLLGEPRVLERVLSEVVPNSVPLRVVWVGLTPSVLVGPLGDGVVFVPPLVDGVSVVSVVVPEGGFERVGGVSVVEAPLPVSVPVVVPVEVVSDAVGGAVSDAVGDAVSGAVSGAVGVSVFVTTTRDERAADFVAQRLEADGFVVVKESLGERFRLVVVAGSLVEASDLIVRLREFGYLAYVMSDVSLGRFVPVTSSVGVPRAGAAEGAVEDSIAAMPNDAVETPNAAVPNDAVETPNAAVPNDAVETPNAVMPNDAVETPNAVMPNDAVETPPTIVTNDAIHPTHTSNAPQPHNYTHTINTTETKTYIHITNITDTNTLNHNTIPTTLHPITITLDGDTINAYLGPYHPNDAPIISNELDNLNIPNAIKHHNTTTPTTPTTPEPNETLINGMRTITLNETLNGTYLQLTTSNDPNRLTDERNTVTSLGYTPYLLQRSTRYSIIIGPLDPTNINELRRQLRQKGITSFTLNETQSTLQELLTNPTRITNTPPNTNTPTTNANKNTTTNETTNTTQNTPPPITLINLNNLTEPRNYLQLTPHNPNNPPPPPPNAITTTHNNQTITLIGPIPNNQLQTTADNLNYPGIITTHPMPTPTNITPNTENQTWTNTGYQRLHLNAHTEAREAFIEALYWDVTARETLLGLAITEHLTNNPNAAEFAYQYLLRHHPNDIDGNYNLSILHLQNNNPQQALPHLTTALNTATQQNNTHWLTRINLTLGHTHTQLNQHEQAANAYATSNQLTPNTDTLLHQYNAHYRNGRTLELLPELTIHERNTNDPRITHLITTIYLTENQPQLAIDTLTRRINRNPNPNDPNLTTLHATKAEIHTQQNQTQQAIREWETTLTIDPTNTLAFNNIITLHLINNNPHTAKHKILTNPQFLTNPTTLTLLTEIAHRTNDTQLLNTLTNNPNLPTTPQNDLILANHNCNQQNYTECLTRTTRILNNPNETNNTYAIALHAEANYHTENYTESINQYQRLIDMNIDAREHLATAQLAAGQFQNAKNTLTQLTQQQPTNTNALHMLGWAQLRTNEIEPARQTWLKAINQNHQPSTNDHNRVFTPTNHQQGETP